jgi:uncharacterized protein (TIGR00266 family)
MQHSIEHGPAFAWLRVKLAPNETLTAEAGAMVTRSPGLDMTTRLNSGTQGGLFAKLTALFVALVRKAFGGETMFINDFHGSRGGEVIVAPGLSGQIVHHELDGQRSLWVQAGSFLASSPGIETRLRWGGLRTLLGGEGLFLMRCTGRGDLFLNSYGGIVAVDVEDTYVVDTGHLVAFEGSLDFKVRSVGGGLKGLLFSGEGLVMEFRGKGTLYLQSRNLGSLAGWLNPFLR